MAGVTVAGGGIVVIPVDTGALATAAQTALVAITSLGATGTQTQLAYAGPGNPPTTSGATTLTVSAAAAFTLPSLSNIDQIINTATDPVSIADASHAAVTVVSSVGGLTFDRSDSAAGAALILATGGDNVITLGSAPATVGVGGTAIVSALTGAASVFAAPGGAALLRVGASATVTAAGSDTVAFGRAPVAQVTVADGANVLFSNDSGSLTPIVALAAGTQVIGTMAGSTTTVAGSSGGMMLVSAWGGRTFVNPGAANVTVFAGSGSETLFGAGDASLPGVAQPAATQFAGHPLANSASDFVFGGSGYFHGGSGALNLLISSTVAGATTLVGGGNIDLLFSQGAGDSLRGAAGTVIMNAAGFAEPGFSVLAAGGGVALDAGGSNAFMFGAAWGSNTIVSGTGASTVFGNHGTTGRVGNLYVDGGPGGSLSILDFLPGVDTVSLRGDTVTRTTTVAVGQAGTPGTYVTLADGTTIGFVDQFLTQSQISTTFR